MDSAITSTILPPIFFMIQLRRTVLNLVKKLGKVVRVAAEEPSNKVVTVELAMNALQANEYAKTHKSLAPKLGNVADEETG